MTAGDMKKSKGLQKLEFQPLTTERWDDLETLFGKNGAWGGCWCMWWRLSSSEFERRRGEGNHKALRGLAGGDRPPGILAYEGGRPVGWCSLGPREDFPRLERSPILKKVDDTPVWSIVCFYIARTHRRMGLSQRLVEAAIDYARGQGADVLEGYPIETNRKSYPVVSAWTGFPATFERAGFKEALRRRPRRPIVRYELTDD